MPLSTVIYKVARNDAKAAAKACASEKVEMVWICRILVDDKLQACSL